MSLFWGGKKKFGRTQTCHNSSCANCTLSVNFYPSQSGFMEMCGWSSKLVSDTGLVYQCQQGPQVQSSWVFGKGEAKKHLSGPLGPFCSFFPGETVWAPCRNRESPTVPSVHPRRRFFTGPSVGAFLPLYLSGDLIKGTEMGPGQFTAFWGLTWSPFQGKDLYPTKASNQLRANRLGKMRHPQTFPVLPVCPPWRNWFANTRAAGAQWNVVRTSGAARTQTALLCVLQPSPTSTFLLLDAECFTSSFLIIGAPPLVFYRGWGNEDIWLLW